MNISIVYSSLKHINNNFRLIVKLSTYINDQLININYSDDKLYSSFEKNDHQIAESIINLVQDNSLFGVYLCRSKYEIIKLILDYGVDQEIKDKALRRFASWEGNSNIVKLLLENGVKLYNKALVDCWDIDTAKLLIEHGANVYYNNNEVLWKCFDEDRRELGKFLLENYSFIITIDQKFKLASYFGCYDTVKSLLENGEDIHAGNDQLLHFISETNDIELFKLLLKYGLEVNIKILKQCCDEDHFEICNLLFDHVSIETLDPKETILIACKCNRLGIVKKLINKNMDLRECLNEAILWRHYLITKFLLEYGVQVNRSYDEHIEDSDILELLKRFRPKITRR